MIGAQTGTVFADFVATLGGSETKYFDSQAAIITAVANGQVDAAFTDSAVLAYGLVENPNDKVKIVDPYDPHFPGIIGAAVNKDDAELLKDLNSGLADLKKSPKYSRSSRSTASERPTPSSNDTESRCGTAAAPRLSARTLSETGSPMDFILNTLAVFPALFGAVPIVLQLAFGAMAVALVIGLLVALARISTIKISAPSPSSTSRSFEAHHCSCSLSTSTSCCPPSASTSIRSPPGSSASA